MRIISNIGFDFFLAEFGSLHQFLVKNLFGILVLFLTNIWARLQTTPSNGG
jgi:hypothetical protein